MKSCETHLHETVSQTCISITFTISVWMYFKENINEELLNFHNKYVLCFSWTFFFRDASAELSAASNSNPGQRRRKRLIWSPSTIACVWFASINPKTWFTSLSGLIYSWNFRFTSPNGFESYFNWRSPTPVASKVNLILW